MAETIFTEQSREDAKAQFKHVLDLYRGGILKADEAKALVAKVLDTLVEAPHAS